MNKKSVKIRENPWLKIKNNNPRNPWLKILDNYEMRGRISPVRFVIT